MVETSLQINSSDTENKKVSTTVSYVNPEVTNATLKSFAQMLNGLTKNVFLTAVKVTKEGLI